MFAAAEGWSVIVHRVSLWPNRDPLGDVVEGFVAVISPMGLSEHVVDLLEVDDWHLVAHRFDEASQAEIARAAQQALGGADD